MSDNIEMTPQAKWNHLKEEGVKLLIDLQNNDKIDGKPSWLDEERFSRAREVIQKYFIGVSFSSFTGLLLILQLPEGLEPLLSTGNSKDIPSLYRRYLNTILHINSWYDDDVFDPATKGYKSIRQVRGMHKRVQSLMNDKFQVKALDGSPRTWLNQYDLALTQFAFIGLAMLFPDRCGMIAASKEELELLNYYWRVLGSLMGIEDEFNACQFDKYEDILEFNRLIFENGYLIPFKQLPCQKGLEMTKSICVALHYFMPLMTFNQLAHWWKDQFQFNGYELEQMSAKERLFDCITRVNFNHLFKYDGFAKFVTKFQRKRFVRRLKNKDKVYEKLKAQYKDKDNLTYFSDRVDYFKVKNDNTTTVLLNSGHTAEIGAISDEGDNDNNNNNNDSHEQVYTKTNGCPFGYGATIVSPPINHQETTVSS